MNLSKAVEDFSSELKHRIMRVRTSRLMGDSLSVTLVISSLVINFLAITILVLKLHPLDYQVPIHYSSINGFDQLGAWYRPFYIAGFSLAVTIVNTILAIRSFGRSRVAAFYLLLGSVVVGIFCLIICNAFSSIA
jgi:hypothetical protein